MDFSSRVKWKEKTTTSYSRLQARKSRMLHFSSGFWWMPEPWQSSASIPTPQGQKLLSSTGGEALQDQRHNCPTCQSPSSEAKRAPLQKPLSFLLQNTTGSPTPSLDAIQNLQMTKCFNSQKPPHSNAPPRHHRVTNFILGCNSESPKNKTFQPHNLLISVPLQDTAGSQSPYFHVIQSPREKIFPFHNLLTPMPLQGTTGCSVPTFKAIQSLQKTKHFSPTIFSPQHPSKTPQGTQLHHWIQFRVSKRQIIPAPQSPHPNAPPKHHWGTNSIL